MRSRMQLGSDPNRSKKMKKFSESTKEELQEILKLEQEKYESYLAQGISINMARGRPCTEQLNLSDELYNLTADKCGVKSADGLDCRNYGVLPGIEEIRSLFGEIMGLPSKNVIACGSSSLNLMFDYLAQCCLKGINGSEPWCLNPKRKIIGVVPGYDRHFAVSEYLGFEIISVNMTENGPDMDAIREIVKDPDVKAMFCVPKYSNPDGITYSPETVEALASMETAEKNFRIIWDEAYIVHDLYEEGDYLANCFELAAKYGNEDRFVAFASTSKITFAGAGLSAVGASDANIAEILERMTSQIISYDKINQLKHSFFYKSLDDIKAQMKKHAEILRPKFDMVLDTIEAELGGLGIAAWNKPRGGYFISFDVMTGSAKYVGQLCKECGITMTGVGATYPYGKDPNDRNIRIAPSCPTVAELETASKVLSCAVKIAACKELLGE